MLQDVENYLTQKCEDFTNSVYNILGYGEQDEVPEEEQEIVDHVSTLQNQLLTQWQLAKKDRYQQLSDLLRKNPEVALKINDIQVLNDIYTQAKQTVIDAYQVNPDAFSKHFDGNINTLLSV